MRLEFVFADLVGLFSEMLDQHPNGPGIALLSAKDRVLRILQGIRLPAEPKDID